MFLKRLLAFACTGWTLTLPAQDSTSTKKWKLVSAELVSAYTNYFEKQMQPATLLQLAPNLQGLKVYQSIYIGEGAMHDSAGYRPIALRVEGSRRQHPRVRYTGGVKYEARELHYLTFKEQSTIPFDTLTASNGDVLYLDSLKTRTESFSWQLRLLAFQLGQTFQPSRKKSSVFYVGYQIDAGIALKSNVQAFYNTTAVKLVTLFPSPSVPPLGSSSYSPERIDVQSETVKTARVSFTNCRPVSRC